MRTRPAVPVLLSAAAIVAATALVYSNTWNVPFLFDDNCSIAENSTVHSLWPIWGPLEPPAHGEPVTGRPLVNLSLAVNYAVNRLDVRGYHAVNLAIHVLAALTLFGVLRRTFLLMEEAERRAPRRGIGGPTSLALVVSLLWAIHPLQTESVTYIVQRAESLAGLFYLLTLYCTIRGATAGPSGQPNSRRKKTTADADGRSWYIGAATACLLGMASKEIMASAPLIVLLYDRAFLSGSFREAWRRRRGLYVALAGTWLLLVWLIVASSGRGGTAGLGTTVGSWSYFCTQCVAIVHYLRLCVWPDALTLDYGKVPMPITAAMIPYAAALVVLGVATVVAIWRYPKIGFLGAWFFAILAPTSSFVPVATQVMAEHRMYLPLAAVVVAAVVGGHWALRRWLLPRSLEVAQRSAGWKWAVFAVVGLVVAAVGCRTFLRNQDYRSDVSIWADAARRCPRNARAHNNLGLALAGRRRMNEAAVHYREALAIDPRCVEAHYNLGVVLADGGRTDEAVAHYQEALRIDPACAEAHNNLGLAMVHRGRIDEAVRHFRLALEAKPDYVKSHYNLGAVLADHGMLDDAILHFQRALKLNPEFADAHNDLGMALASCGRLDEAVDHYQQALAIKPKFAKVYYNLGKLLMHCGRIDEAAAHYRQAIQIDPAFAEAYNDLGIVLAGSGRTDEAVACFRRALEINPGYAAARKNLDIVLSSQKSRPPRQPSNGKR